jgi:predicted CopG family antitoxin
MAYTTIPVQDDTRDAIQDLKRGGESYDELLTRMLEQYNE